MGKIIGVLDTETNGLNRPIGTALEQQPHLTELCLITMDEDGIVKNQLDTLVKSPVPQPDHIIKITKIDDHMLSGAPSPKKAMKQLKKQLKKCDVLVMQNFCFDEAIIKHTAERTGTKVKLPPVKFCTVEQSMFIFGRRLKLSELYLMATGESEYNAHRAKGDVLATIQVYLWLQRIINDMENYNELVESAN